MLGRDVGFYVFTLPFLRFLHALGQAFVITAAVGAALIYLVSGSLTSGFPATISLTSAARRHLALLAAAFLLLLAVGAWLHRSQYLVQPSGLIHGASYADVHGRMPAMLLLIAVSIVGAGLALLQALTPRKWPIPVAIALYFVVSIGGEVYSTVLQRFVVSPNEQVRETPFIQHNIAATRAAFALDGVEQRELSGDALLTAADLDRNRDTLDNVRLWDHQPLLETFGQIQEIRTYYDFAAVDNDRYRINGSLRQVMLSATRAQLRRAAEPDVGERAADVHARLRPDARAGQPGDQRGSARAVRPRFAAGKHRRPRGRGTEHLLRRTVQRLRHRPDPDARVPLPAR